uniref:Nucleotidyltransferase family protein n=1 Tax=Prevotella sp. GTC17262 TaxID=3236797 RepID=A0AB33JFX1_9BACT
MMQAMIFAAGLGTRLKPLTDSTPKALVRVGGEPLLKHVVLKLKDSGFTRLVVNVHHFANQIIDYLDANANFGVDILISDEREGLLETGGGIKKARPFFDLSAPILIHNVDILSNIDLKKFYEEGMRSDATLLVSTRKTKRYFLFSQGDSHLLKGWTNIETHEVKSPYQHLEISDHDMYAFSGIHVFSPSLFTCMDDMPDKFGIVDFYLKYCKDRVIRGYVKDNLKLMDVGKLETLHDAEKFLNEI